MHGEDYKTNRNTIYQWTVAAHTGGFTQAIPAQAAGSYLITFNVQMSGAAGDPANPNVINCRIIQNGVSGTVAFQKAILAETQVTSVDTPAGAERHQPAHPGRRRLARPRLHDDAQQPAVVDHAVPAGDGQPAAHRRLVRLRAPLGRSAKTPLVRDRKPGLRVGETPPDASATRGISARA